MIQCQKLTAFFLLLDFFIYTNYCVVFAQPYDPFVLENTISFQNFQNHLHYNPKMDQNSPRFTPSPENSFESQIESELLHGIDPSVPTTNFIDNIRNK